MNRIGVVALALAAFGAACSGDDDAQPATTPPTATSVAVTTGPPTTVAPTAPPSTTAAPTTTQSVEQLKAEVEAAFVDLEDKNLALLMEPKVPDLAASIAEIAVPGSPYSQAITDRVNDLVAKNESVRLNNPNLRKITVERVEVLDPPANTHVNVTVCQVGNALLVKNADASPIPGRSIPVQGYGSGDLTASRFTVDLVLTPAGWRHSGGVGPDAAAYPNVTECPAS